MGKSGPTQTQKPLGPKDISAAQTSTNISTAIAQQNLNNINQVTPDGSLTYQQSGTYSYVDPVTGQTYHVPQYTATQKLSPQQQAIKDQHDAANLNLSRLGAEQSGRLGSVLNRNADMSTLPSRGDANTIRRANLQRVGSGPTLQTQLGDVGQVNRQIANAGSIQQNLGDVGSIHQNLGDAGSVQKSLGNAGSIQQNLGDAGQVTRTYGTNFSQDRQRVEDALMDRMSPRLEQDRQRLESRLASQGIRIGSEAYNAAMDDYSRQTNDARLGAILNAGQEQNRLANLEAQRAGFENAAQAQAFNQLAQRGSFANQAQQQQFNQLAQRGSFANQAQQQQFNQLAQRGSFANQAQQQQFNQLAQRGSFANQAQQQQFNQNAAGAQFTNQAQAQAFQQAAARAEFANNTNQQMHQNYTQGVAMNNQSQLQEADADIAKFNAMNQARQQALHERFAIDDHEINKVASLLSNSQYRTPNFITPNTAQIAPTDYVNILTNYKNMTKSHNGQPVARTNSYRPSTRRSSYSPYL